MMDWTLLRFARANAKRFSLPTLAWKGLFFFECVDVCLALRQQSNSMARTTPVILRIHVWEWSTLPNLYIVDHTFGAYYSNKGCKLWYLLLLMIVPCCFPSALVTAWKSRAVPCVYIICLYACMHACALPALCTFLPPSHLFKYPSPASLLPQLKKREEGWWRTRRRRRKREALHRRKIVHPKTAN